MCLNIREVLLGPKGALLEFAWLFQIPIYERQLEMQQSTVENMSANFSRKSLGPIMDYKYDNATVYSPTSYIHPQ